MACHSGPNLVEDNIGLYLDSVNKKSYNPDEIIRSDAPNTWTAITSLPEEGWKGICYGNGRFVAVASGGTNRVAWSTDGINWTAASASEEHLWYSVAYGNGTFVAVSSIWYSNDVDRVMTSGSGASWVTRNATYNHMWRSVCFGNGYFVAVADDHYNGGTNANKRVMYSTTGYTWTAGPLVQGNSWKSVCHGNGKFVAVANSGTNRVMYSSDGINWSNSGLSGVAANYWYGVTYGNGYFVAVSGNGTNRVMYSTDGINWTAASSPINDEPWWGIAYGNGKFVATQIMGGSPGTSTNQLMYNTDGFTYPALTDIVKEHTATFNSDLPRSGSLDLFEFNGINDHIEFLSNSDIAFGTDDFTLEIWVKFSYLGGDRPIWETRSSTTANDGFLIYVNTDGGLYMKTGTSYTIANSSAGIVTDTWYHIAVSRIGGTVTQYLNAVQSGAQAVGTVTNYSNDDLYIGKDVSDTDRLYGKISIVRVYKGKGLTLSEVKRHFNVYKRRYQ